jgi:predicted MFS family arabinose efflux permease
MAADCFGRGGPAAFCNCTVWGRDIADIAADRLIRAADTSIALRWYVLTIMCLVYAINIADRYVVTTVMEPMRLDLHLGDSGIALLTGPPLALFYVTLGIPISWLADHANRRNILAGALVAWSGMTALCGLSRTYSQFMLARIGVGVGEAGGTPPANCIIADCFPAARRPMAMAIFALGAPLGAYLGADMAGWVANLYGWRAAFLALGVPGLILGVLVLTTIGEPVRGCLDARHDRAKASFMQSMAFLWAHKAAVHVIMAGGVAALWGWGLMWFTPTFLQRTYHLSVGEAGAVVGPIHLIGGSAASVATAWILACRPFADPRRVLWLLGAGVGVATIPSFIAYQTHSLPLARAMFWIFIPAIYFYIGPTMALVQNLAPCRMRATFIAVSLLVPNVLNLIVAPQGVGLISDLAAGPHGPDAASLRLGLLILAPTGFWAAWHYWAACRTVVADQRAAIG